MNKYPFLSFVFLQIYKSRSKHLSIFVISTILVMFLSSFLFMADSIKNNIKLTIDNQADFVLQRIISGKVVDTPVAWVDEMLSINGISTITPRVYGKYFFEPAEHYFTIVGVDFFDKQVLKNLKQIVNNIDIEKFLLKENMIIGDGVKKFFDYYEYFDYYSFRPPDRSIKRVYIYDKFNNSTNIVSSDMIIVDIETAKTILGIEEGKCTDIVFNVPNSQENQTIINKLRINYFDSRIIHKTDLDKNYTKFFNYQSSLFLILYGIAIITFMLILYQRYSIINSTDKKNIGVLRSLGWSVDNIIKLKIYENMIIFVSSFILGLVLSYIYVFIFNAPILQYIFFGFNNLDVNISLTPTINFTMISMLFFIYIVPIIFSILIPVWRIATINPSESMK